MTHVIVVVLDGLAGEVQHGPGNDALTDEVSDLEVCRQDRLRVLILKGTRYQTPLDPTPLDHPERHHGNPPKHHHHGNGVTTIETRWIAREILHSDTGSPWRLYRHGLTMVTTASHHWERQSKVHPLTSSPLSGTGRGRRTEG